MFVYILFNLLFGTCPKHTKQVLHGVFFVFCHVWRLHGCDHQSRSFSLGRKHLRGPWCRAGGRWWLDVLILLCELDFDVSSWALALFQTRTFSCLTAARLWGRQCQQLIMTCARMEQIFCCQAKSLCESKWIWWISHGSLPWRPLAVVISPCSIMFMHNCCKSLVGDIQRIPEISSRI